MFVSAALPAAAADRAPGLVLSLAGEETVVFDWQTERCEEWHIPDAPLRAFRNDRGEVVAFASHHRNRPLVGADLASLRARCDIALEGERSPDPARHSDMDWIAATWTADGRRVEALLHGEFHADRHPGACRFKDGMSCWYNVVTTAVSEDGGRSFRRPDPPVVVAGPLAPQDVGQGRHRGFFNPSNIVSRDGAWYVLIATTGGEGQKPGTCLFRTADIADPEAWRGWDGEGFTVAGYDAYRPQGRAPVGCRPVARFPNVAGSVTLHRPSGLYVALFALGPDAAHPDGSLAYATSPDLIGWSELATLDARPTMWSKTCGAARYAYPSLVDPDAPDRNFETTDGDAFLFLTRFHLDRCRMGPDRDLVRLDVRIAPR